MEEKINNQKIFTYIPSLIMKLILDNPLKDKDVFPEQIKKKVLPNNNNNSKCLSPFVNTEYYPIINELPSSLVMIIKLGGFYKLVSTLVLKDQKNQKEKLISEYLSIITPRILLKVSAIIGENGGEIVKYNDYELIAVWLNENNKNIKYNLFNIYNKFNAKLALITAIDLLKKVDRTEISTGIQLELSIGISLGDISCIFFGGERKRAEYVFFGEGINNAEECLSNCLPHEVIIDKELNEVFQKGEEIRTIDINEKKKYFSLLGYNEDDLKDFKIFKGIKPRNNNLIINKAFFENLKQKMALALSIIPSGLLKYLDLGVEINSQEINVITVETIIIHLEPDIMNNLKEIQNIIFDIQKSIYLAFGILIHISKIEKGLLVRCVWGIDPSSFIDDTARAISTASIIGNLTKNYAMKIGIGITTGACYSGLINLQGNKKVFTLLGKKVILSRILAEEACKNAENNEKIKYIIYCDKSTMNYSQKWYRHIFVSQLKIFLTKKDDIYNKYRIEFYDGKTNDKIIKQIKFDKNIPLEKSNIDQNNIEINPLDESKNKNDEITEKKNILENIIDIESKNDEEYKKMKKKFYIENEYILINEIFSPIEEEEYFIPSYYDPFPLLRTHINNSFNPKNKLYFRNILQISNNESISESKTAKIRVHSMSNVSIHKAQSHSKMMLKLKKSLTIFGCSSLIKKFITILNRVYKINKRQFFLIKGPLGIGKTLFVRKCLNDFIGTNDFMSKNFFRSDQFLFCNIVKPINNVLPFNVVNFILREIFLNIKKIKKIKELYKETIQLGLTNENLKDISFILSIGKSDINLLEEFLIDDIIMEKEEDINIINNEKKKVNNKITKEKSSIKYLEGPFDFGDKYKIYEFFLCMIILYKKYLDNKKRDIFAFYKINKNDKRYNRDINKLPLILIIDDLHFSDIYSIEFIQYLFANDKESLNPFFVILIEQTPFNEKFSPLTHRNLEQYLFLISEESDKPKEDRIIKFNMKSLIEKEELQKLIIFNNREAVMKKYKTNLESVDEQILDFLLMKTFNGIPLLVLTLFEALIKSEKFIQKLSGEFIITSELIDDNIIHDWSDLLLPYVYEKINSKMINSLLCNKEIMILKYASIIGNIFDLKTLEKLNQLKSTIKVKDMEKIINKLNNEYLLEIYYQDVENKNNKIQNIIGQFTFPLMREILHQKFPMERRAILHMEAAKILSTSKRNIYFSVENELKIFKRHLLYSEMNIINEIESKDIKTVQDILQNKMVLNYNNLKLYVVKEIFSKFYVNYTGNIMEGNLEIYYNNKWLKITYNIDKMTNIYINYRNPNKDKDEIIMTIPIKTIYKKTILSDNLMKIKKSNNMLAIYQSLENEPIEQNNKKIILFSSEQREEICKLDIAINFIRVKVNYDKYIFGYGLLQLPLYKIKWFKRKSLLFYSGLEQNGISIYNNSNNLINSNEIKYLEANKTEKDLQNTKSLKSSFNIIFKSTLSIFFAQIQEKLTKINERKHFIYKNYSYDFNTPYHVKKKINYFLKISIKNMNKEMKIFNRNNYFRRSMSMFNPFQNDFSLLNEFKAPKKKEKEKKFESDKKIFKEMKKKTLEEIKEINEIKELYEPIKKLKKKKIKRKSKKNKKTGTIVGHNIQKTFDRVITQKKIENDISKIKIDSQENEKVTNNTEIITEKKDEIDDICVNEFNLEDDDDINISINNIDTTFSLANYITCPTEPDKKSKFFD